MADETGLLSFPFCCHKCKRDFGVNIVKLKLTLCNEPDSK
ncbi:MAG: hypothetical protein CVU99_04720 [Firmicutes bacterium HGW-Firmicutes-4]|nr:MAG: hypothetical protein CVU99_04720 [Firmicutes bacterium HGW-Firmicutes-4]